MENARSWAVRGTASRRVPVAFVLLLLALVPAIARAQEQKPSFWDETALWAELNYTLLWKKSVVWVVTPAFRTDEQELNYSFATRITTDVTVALPREWDVRSRYFLIGHGTETDEVVVDQRIQVLVRKTLLRFHDRKIRFRAGAFYERHFRGDQIPDFNVYRTRLELRGDGLWNEPWAQQDFFFDHGRGFFRTRARVGLLWNLKWDQQVRLAYQFQYTEDALGVWEPQHAIVFRYWFGNRLSWRGVN